MKTVLIIISTDELAIQAAANLARDHKVLLCHDAQTASVLMEHHPDAMVVQMELPGTDGLTFLEGLTWKPTVILSLAVQYTPYSAQRLYDLGVGHFVTTPCTLEAVTDRMRDMLRDQNLTPLDPQSVTSSHLNALGISSESDGGKLLRVGIPLYAQDPHQKLNYQLYPAIAEICGTTSCAVEQAIRRTITDSWTRKNSCWEKYFPHCKKCPSNKTVLSELAKKIG